MKADEYENHCPYKCQGDDLDERKYCKHLIGFTNDGEMMEPLEKIMRKEDDPENPGKKRLVDSGNLRVNGRKLQPIPEAGKGDEIKLVNPEYQQLDNGVYHTAKLWVSARVYKKKVDEPVVVKQGD